MIPNSLLRAIMDEPQPCEHIETLAEFLAKQPVVIAAGNSDDPPIIECPQCDIIMSYRAFAGLVMGAMQGRN